MKTKLTILVLILFVYYGKAQTISSVLMNDTLNFYEKIEQIELIKEDASKGLTTIDSSALKRYDRYVAFWDSRIDKNIFPKTFINQPKMHQFT